MTGTQQAAMQANTTAASAPPASFEPPPPLESAPSESYTKVGSLPKLAPEVRNCKGVPLEDPDDGDDDDDDDDASYDEDDDDS